MKTIGLIGGLTWLSTVEYYKLLNQLVNERLGGAEAAKVIIYSVNFGDIKTLTVEDRWAEIAVLIIDAAQKLEKAGAECLLIGANTMHRIAPEIQAQISIPIIHVAEITGNAIAKMRFKTVALLGTKFTMQLPFYKEKLQEQCIETIIPNEEDIEYINNSIYAEMSLGKFLPTTKEAYLKIIDKLIARGAEGVILGCTEIPILIQQNDCNIPTFDTTYLHAKAAVDFALQ